MDIIVYSFFFFPTNKETEMQRASRMSILRAPDQLGIHQNTVENSVASGGRKSTKYQWLADVGIRNRAGEKLG